MRRKRRYSLSGGGSRARKKARRGSASPYQVKTERRLDRTQRELRVRASPTAVLRAAKAASKNAVHGHCKVAFRQMSYAEELLGNVKSGKTHSKLIRVLARENHTVRNNCTP